MKHRDHHASSAPEPEGRHPQTHASASLRRARALLLLALSGTVLAGGCLERNLAPLEPCTVSGVVKKLRVTNVDKVDLLFMVDDSNSMKEEQANLRTQFPRLVQTLASGRITNPAGAVIGTFPPVKSLHVGVVDSDMGSGGFPVPTCGNGDMGTMFGDDGILRTKGDPTIPGCSASYPMFLTFAAGGDPMALSQDFDCVSDVGTNGCGFEQQLESPLKALTPSTSPITFSMGTVGHGDRENAGFLRPDSLLTVVVVTDEDECTPINPELFHPNTSNPTFPGDLNLRCFKYPGAVQPASRYVNGFLALRQGEPGLFIFAAITGVPADLLSGMDPNNLDYDAILADSSMQERPDPADPLHRLATSCDRAGTGTAYPPRRIVQVAKGIHDAGSTGVIQSICADDFEPAINTIIDKIAAALKGACLPRALNPKADGSVSCDVVETLPALGSGADVTHCSQLADKGRDGTPLRMVTDADGTHEVCKVKQIVPNGCDPNMPGQCPPGWYYEDAAHAPPTSDIATTCPMDHQQRISYTAGDEPVNGTEVDLECLQPLSTGSGGGPGGDVILGSPCTPGAMDDCGTSAQVRGMTCDADSHTCQLPCTSDADCSNENLGGFVCDGICKNPTCGT